MRILKVTNLLTAAVAATGLCLAGTAQAEKWDMPMAYSVRFFVQGR